MFGAQLILLATTLVITHHALAADRIRIAVSNPNMPNLTSQMALSAASSKTKISTPRSSA